MKFLVTFRPNWWIIGAIFEEICIYVEENEGFGQPLIPFILLIGELQMGPYMVTYWCVSECCSLIGSHRLYVYRNDKDRSEWSNLQKEELPALCILQSGGHKQPEVEEFPQMLRCRQCLKERQINISDNFCSLLMSLCLKIAMCEIHQKLDVCT